MNVMALLLADSRFPGGGHVHSGGLEEAAARGLVRTETDLPAFLRNRLRTAGALAAVFAAAAAGPDPDWLLLDAELDARTPSEAQRSASRAQGRATARAARAMLTGDGSAREGGTVREGTVRVGGAPRDGGAVRVSGALREGGLEPGAGALPGARTVRESHSFAEGAPGFNATARDRQFRAAPPDPGDKRFGDGVRLGEGGREEVRQSEGRRDESLQGGGGLGEVRQGDGRRGVSRWGPVAGLLAVVPRPHHPVILGALVGVPSDAALSAAYLSVSGPASASVRLLGLDPLRVNAIVASLAAEIAAVADVVVCAPADLPAPGSPGLDVLAEEHDRHHREEVRLFAS